MIILISAFLRIYRLPELFVVEGDLEHHLLLANTIVKDFHIIWIGVNAAHLGFYHGPYWTYFTAIWLYLSNGFPLILAYISALIGIVTTCVVIFAGRQIFNQRVGLIAGFLYATLPLFVFYDQKYWNPSPTMLLSLLIFISLCLVPRWPYLWILFAAAYGVVFSTHLSLVPIILLAIYVYWKLPKKPNVKISILTILTFLVFFSPLIIFDYYQKGRNITTPLRFNDITKEERDHINPIFHSETLFLTLGRLFYLAPDRPNSDEVLVSCSSASIINTPKIVDEQSTRTEVKFISTIVLLGLLVFAFRKSVWENFNTRLLLIQTGIILFAFLLFPGGSYEYYMIGAFPLILLIFACLIDSFPKNIRLVSYYVISLLIILGTNTVLTAKNDYGYQTKVRLVQKVMAAVDDKPFEIKQDNSICHQYEGWRYLFVYHGKTPARSFSDQALGWYYPDEISKDRVDYTVILGDTRIHPEFDTQNAKIIQEGGFKAYVIENK